MAAEPVTLIAMDHDHLVGAWRDVFFIVWRRDTTTAAVHALQRDMRRFAAQRRTGMATLVIVEESAARPSGAARAEMSRLLREQAPKIAASGIAMEGSGFRAAAVRSVLTGMSIIVRPSYPHRVCASLRDATGWLASACEGRLASFSGEELRQAIEDERARFPVDRLASTG